MSQSRDIPVSQRFCICVCVCVLVCHCKCPTQRVTNSTCAVFQLKAHLKPRTSYSHFLSCFGVQKTMLFPQEAGHPLSFPPALSFPHHLLGLWDHGHYDSTNCSGKRRCSTVFFVYFFIAWHGYVCLWLWLAVAGVWCEGSGSECVGVHCPAWLLSEACLLMLSVLAHLKVFSQLWVEISRADCARVSECTCAVSAWGSLFVFLQHCIRPTDL